MKHGRILLAAVMLQFFMTLIANAALNLTDSGMGVYDSNLGLSWSQDANLLGTLEANATAQYGNDSSLILSIINSNVGVVRDNSNTYDNGSYSLTASDFAYGGMVDWWGAQAFVGYLNHISYAGSNQWVLPTTIDSDASVGYGQTGSQLGDLFYNALGGAAGAAMPSGPFSNVQSFGYWSGTEYSANPNNSWVLGALDGNQFYYDKNSLFYAWAVTPVTISTVPVPASFWFLSTGMVGLFGLKRRQLPLRVGSAFSRKIIYSHSEKASA